MNDSISIIGGDVRNIELAKILQEEYKEKYIINTYSIEKSQNTLQEVIEKSNFIITSVPLSKDKINLYTPYSDEKISLEKLFSMIKNKTVITANISEEYEKILQQNNNKVVDLLKCNDYAILNAEPTSEGAIQIAMENTTKTLQYSNVLVIGYGKIGKILTKQLKAFEANVHCTARKDTDFATMYINGIKKLEYENLSKEISKFDIIFNTVPSIILRKEELEKIKNDAVIIELASKPGGIDLEESKNYNFKIINAQGLPGKVAPKTAAQIIEKTLKKYL